MPISVLENVRVERRAARAAHGESPVVPRVTDIYAALPSMTGKFELEYEGELKGAEHVARELVRARSPPCSTATSRRRHRGQVDRMVRPRRQRSAGGHDRRRGRWSTDAAAVQGWSSSRVTRRHRSPTRRRRRSRPRSTSCSRGCTRRRRSAAATSAAITAPNRCVVASRTDAHAGADAG